MTMLILGGGHGATHALCYVTIYPASAMERSNATMLHSPLPCVVTLPVMLLLRGKGLCQQQVPPLLP